MAVGEDHKNVTDHKYPNQEDMALDEDCKGPCQEDRVADEDHMEPLKRDVAVSSDCKNPHWEDVGGRKRGGEKEGEEGRGKEEKQDEKRKCGGEGGEGGKEEGAEGGGEEKEGGEKRKKEGGEKRKCGGKEGEGGNEEGEEGGGEEKQGGEKRKCGGEEGEEGEREEDSELKKNRRVKEVEKEMAVDEGHKDHHLDIMTTTENCMDLHQKDLSAVNKDCKDLYQKDIHIVSKDHKDPYQGNVEVDKHCTSPCQRDFEKDRKDPRLRDVVAVDNNKDQHQENMVYDYINPCQKELMNAVWQLIKITKTHLEAWQLIHFKTIILLEDMWQLITHFSEIFDGHEYLLWGDTVASNPTFDDHIKQDADKDQSSHSPFAQNALSSLFTIIAFLVA